MRLIVPLVLTLAFVQAPPAADPSLLRDIQAIKAIDNHAHVMRPTPDDRDFDALPIDALDPTPLPARLRKDSPQFVRAWKALFGYPYADASDAHLKEVAALKQRKMKERGAGYPAWVLDQQGIDIVLANRVSMGPELQAPRFRWVPFADALIFPLDNSGAKSVNRDYAAFYPAEEKLLQRYMLDAGVRALPPTLSDYCRLVITPTLERHKAGGAVAEKFEIAYLRWLDFGPAAEADASRVYAEYAKGGPPPAREYKTLQDYLFAYVAREAGRLELAIHIHVNDGGGGNYDQRGSNPLLLTWLFNEPSLRKGNFVIVHGGYPFARSTGSLLSKPNVYADIAGIWFAQGVHAEADILRDWLTLWPEKILFGTDATPLDEPITWEETGWLGSMQAREALAAALTGMIRDGEVTRARALELARMVLRTNAARLYGFQLPQRTPPG